MCFCVALDSYVQLASLDALGDDPASLDDAETFRDASIRAILGLGIRPPLELYVVGVCEKPSGSWDDRETSTAETVGSLLDFGECCGR